MPISPEALGSVLPALETVGERALDQLARASSVRKYRAKAVLYRTGDVADGLYVVISGRVIVRRETASRSGMLHTEGAGGVLGEIPVFGGGRFPATATALEPTECWHLPTAVVERLLRDEPRFARFALQRMAVRAQSLLQRIDELTAGTVTARLAAFVAARAAESETQEFTLGRTQEELAAELGTAREVIVRGIARLIAAGAIARAGRSRFVVRRLATLRALVGEARLFSRDGRDGLE
jgi:CRP/FNR family transcriptional regulator, dissimilatory nitrate respiration regulator